MSQNRWRAPHQVCLTDEEFKAVKAEAARCDPPMPFSAWMRMVVMAQVERNRQSRLVGKIHSAAKIYAKKRLAVSSDE